MRATKAWREAETKLAMKFLQTLLPYLRVKQRQAELGILFQKMIRPQLGLPIPLSWHRDPWHVCSEAVFEAFYGAKLVDILPRTVVPLPGDFVTDSPLLEEAWMGRLSAEVVEYYGG